MSQLLHDATTESWVDASLIQRLKKIEIQSADELFISSASRPLIVAFFGGTGTGKSSLLNRLANDSIAKTGVTRPTSHEVTLYLHRDIELSGLTDKLPIGSINIKRHNNDLRKMIAWLDMPDFDSTATANRVLVETWLPYIEWLVYVVSPERYQDDSGWQILLERSKRHRWLFVMNHWDEGSDQQVNDFRKKLTTAGMEDPVILRTSCIEPYIEDDFEQLEHTIQDAITTFGMELLQRSGVEARTDDLRQLLNRSKKVIGDENDWQQTKTTLLEGSSIRLKELSTIIQSSIRAMTQPLIEEGSTSLNPFKKTNSIPPDTSQIIEASLSQRSITLLEDMARELPLSPGIIGQKVIEKQFKNFVNESQGILKQALESGLEQALLTPGSMLQRFLYRLTGTLSWLLPLLAASWAAYHLFITYYQGTTGSENFLGSNFAIHSLLLIAVSWLIPYILHNRLRPSLACAARAGLQNGLKSATDELIQSILSRLESSGTSHQSIIQEISVLEKNLIS